MQKRRSPSLFNVFLFIAFACAGALAGLCVFGLLDLLFNTHWIAFLVGLTAVALVVLVLRLTDALGNWAFQKASEKLADQTHDTLPEEPKGLKPLGLGFGFLVCLVVTRFVPATSIMATFYG